MLVRAMTGNENWRGHSAKLHLFFCPLPPLREIHIGAAARDPASGVTFARQGQSFPAKPGYAIDVGTWTDATYHVPEGTILKLFANKISGGFGAQNLQANMFIALRESGPLVRIHMPLSQDPNARYSNVFVETRADILTFEEATLAGIRTLPQFRTFFQPELIRRMFNVETLENALFPRPTFENREVHTGNQTVVIPMRRRTRALL